MRFHCLGSADQMPDANTLPEFHEVLIEAIFLDKAFKWRDRAINSAGYLPIGGGFTHHGIGYAIGCRTMDATLVATPRQCITEDESG